MFAMRPARFGRWVAAALGIRVLLLPEGLLLSLLLVLWFALVQVRVFEVSPVSLGAFRFLVSGGWKFVNTKDASLYGPACIVRIVLCRLRRSCLPWS